MQLGDFDRYRNAEFVRSGNVTLIKVPGIDFPEIPAGLSGVEAARFENDYSHVHFEIEIGKTPYERWQNNLVLAKAIKELWSLKLAAQFPETRYTLFIWNEFTEWIGGPPRYEIHPTIRFWSNHNDSDNEMRSAFHVEDSNPDHIVLHDDRVIFFPPEDVFTNAGEFKKRFLKFAAS